MSKRETPMIHWYWEQVGGTLIEEFPAVNATPTIGPRRLDAVILPDGPKQRTHWREVSIEGRDVIVIQAKSNRLGMYLMGQAFFSAQLLQRFRPRSILSVALCGKDDDVLRPLFEQHQGMKVVVCPPVLLNTIGR